MIRAVLLDLEGVVYEDTCPIAGAVDAIGALERHGLCIRYITNTTTQPRSAIAKLLGEMGLPIEPNHLVTPAAAAALLLGRFGATRVHLAAVESLAEDFQQQFELVDGTSGEIDAIVLGDLYRGFTWGRLNALFQLMARGVPLVALHKNRIGRRAEGISLDLGPFVAALEYAAAVPAHVVGKPCATFFDLALEGLGLPAREVLMVGDDIEADVAGAKAVGINSVQVRTGKYQPKDDSHPLVTPDGRIDSLAVLPSWISEHDTAI